MDGWFALKAVGIAVAAPVGPMSLLCMQRTLRQGRTQGLAVGAGIAAADFSYAVLGAFGLTALSSVLLAGDQTLRIGGTRQPGSGAPARASIPANSRVGSGRLKK